ncbi:MAG TPA: SGNH/GDSL hydrolase family protein [Anaerolineales bacterium]
MKTILCFGDSNTWGYNPTTQNRYPPDVRWTGVLAQALGPEYRVIEEGLNGRTTLWEDPIEGYKNGREYLIPCLDSHSPLDLVIIMLGTNDLKRRFSVSASDIAASAGVLVDTVQRSPNSAGYPPPQVLLVAPPPFGKLSDYAEMFSQEAPALSRKFSTYYAQQADLYRCHFLDAGAVIVSTDLDGIHFEAGEHRKLGLAVAARVQKIFAG